MSSPTPHRPHSSSPPRERSSPPPPATGITPSPSGDTSFASSTAGLLSSTPRGEKMAEYRREEDEEEREGEGEEVGRLLDSTQRSSRYEKTSTPEAERGARPSRARPPFVSIRLIVGSCLIVISLVFASFFFAPSLHSLLPSSLRQAVTGGGGTVTVADLDAAEDAVQGLGAPSVSHPRPEGPPGSITDTTESWTSIGDPILPPSLQHAASGPENTEGLYWNGTEWFNKTVVVVSLDGVRASYLERGLTPHLVRISEKGLKAESMRPVFPTLTFPNHWSLLTGLHPESHGIVANDFWCPDLNKEFVYTDPFKSWDSEWWSGVPIWAVAERQGVKTANLMWPGPPYLADRTRPTYWRAFENHFRWTRKLNHLLSWLDLPLSSRPQLLLAYLPEVDQTGHSYGPSDPKHAVDKALKGVDAFAGALWGALGKRNLTGAVEVVFVSDHGMTSTADVRVVYLDLLLGEEWYGKITHKEGWPSAGLRFEDDVDTDAVLKHLLQQAKERKGFDVFTHETMPERWHFSGNPRIAPIYIVPHHGWAISDTHEHQVVMNGHYTPRGNHGYDNAEPDMHAFFVAHGPFAEKIKAQRRRSLSAWKGRRWVRRWRRRDAEEERQEVERQEEKVRTIPTFPNLEIFGLVARLLDLKDLPPTNSTPGFWEQYF